MNSNGVSYYEITGIDENNDPVYGEVSHGDSIIENYQCRACGEPLVLNDGRIAKEQEELVEWLTENNML